MEKSFSSERSPLLRRNDSFSSGDEVFEPSSSRNPRWHGCYAYYVLSILLLAYISGQANRLILVFIKDEVQEDIEFSESEYGLLIGYAFSVSYVLFGVPAGMLADKFSRKVLLLGGMLVWSAMCFATGVSQTYYQLLLSRFGLGIGESGFNPAAMALITDYFLPENRVIATSIYNIGVYLGVGLASISSILAHDEWLGWRWLMHSLGFFGLVVGLIIFLSVIEPRKDQKVNDANIQESKMDQVGFKLSLSYMMSLSSPWKLFLAAGFRSFGGYVFAAFVPVYLLDTFHDYSTKLSLFYGIAVIAGGSLSSFLGGVVTKLISKKTKRAPAYVACLGTFLAAPALYVLLNSGTWFEEEDAMVFAIVSLFVVFLVGESWGGPAAFMIQNVLPSSMTASGFGIYFYDLSLISL